MMTTKEVTPERCDREDLYMRMLDWRGIKPDYGDEVCDQCTGSGIKAYGNTSTWRHGIGGQMVTKGICDKCWGSGIQNKPWLNLRTLTHQSRGAE